MAWFFVNAIEFAFASTVPSPSFSRFSKLIFSSLSHKSVFLTYILKKQHPPFSLSLIISVYTSTCMPEWGGGQNPAGRLTYINLLETTIEPTLNGHRAMRWGRPAGAMIHTLSERGMEGEEMDIYALRGG